MLKIKNIKKIYDNDRGLENLSLKVDRGEILCLIGPNGSGKSTALNIIAGIKKADQGACYINKLNTHDTKTKKCIGYLEESAFYYEESTVIDFLNFIWGIKYPGKSNQEIIRLLHKFDLISYKNLKISELSMGLKKRVGIISAIMNYPPLIILDEPTNGIDSRTVITLKEEIIYAKEKNCIIIISSHILDFLKNIATRIVFLKQGEVVDDIVNDDSINLDSLYKSIYMGYNKLLN